MTPSLPAHGLSVQTDRFVHEHLPPPEQCAEMRYELPGLDIPDQANLVDVLLAGIAAGGLSRQPYLRSDKITLSYAQASAQINRIAQVLTENFSRTSTCPPKCRPAR